MGLGPNDSSLLERLDRGGPLVLAWLVIEQLDRGKARLIARIKHQQKHKAKKKPLAPVEQTEMKHALGRMWLWIGEDIPSKAIVKGHHFSSGEIRTAGFRLPKLIKKEKKL